MGRSRPSAGQRLAAAEAAAYAAAMDGLAALQELRDHRLIPDSVYRAHANAVLSRLDPELRVSAWEERRTALQDAVHRGVQARIAATSPPQWLLPPSAGPVDESSPELVADAAYLLASRSSGSAALLAEHMRLGPETVVRVLARLVELKVLSPAGKGRIRRPLVRPAQADAVRAQVLAACRYVPRKEPEDTIADATPVRLPDPVPPPHPSSPHARRPGGRGKRHEP